jgi:hypothetical protein
MLKSSRRKLIAFTCWVTTLVFVVASVTTAMMGAGVENSDPTGPLLMAIVLSFATVGLMLVLKVPDNRMGWIFSIGGLLATTWATAETYYEAAKLNGWSGIGYAAWISQAVYFPMIFCIVALPLLLFPDGEVPSRGWRWVWWLVVSMSGLIVVTSTIQSEFTEEVAGEIVFRVDNPVGIAPSSGFLDSAALNVVFGILLALCLLAPAAAMVYRFHRSKGVERLQLKWLALSAILAGVGLAVFYTAQQWVPEESPWLQLLAGVALTGVLGIPITAGIAITRYHLYDIDRLISRTISYGLLVGLLGAVYILGVFLLGSLAFKGEIQVAVSTFVVAALFNPLRRRLHNLLDRRFSRSSYSSPEVIDGFSHLIRDEIDVDTLVGDLLGVVDETFAPAQRAVWIRE